MSMDKEEQVYKVTKNLRRQLPYDEIRRKVRRDTHLSFSDSVQSINSLISKDLLKHSEKIPFFFGPNPPKEKIKFKDLFQSSVLSDAEIRHLLEGVYGISNERTDADISWDSFRHLLRYFIEVLTVESQQYYFDIKNKDINFVTIGSLPKFVKSSVRDIFYESLIPLDIEKCTVLTEKKKRISIGYPVEKTTDESGNVLLYPVFFIPIESVKVIGNRVKVTTQLKTPDINSSWLNIAFKGKDRDEKYDFLSLCGKKTYATNSDYLYEFYLDSENVENLGWSDLLDALSSKFFSKIKEKLDPNWVNSFTKLENVEDGIYNTVVIGSSNTSNYVKSTIEDLEYISKCSNDILERTSLKYFFGNGSQESVDLEKDSHGNFEYVDSEFVFCGKDTVNLNDLQKRAVSSILSEPVSVIQGPPGTGKSQVIASAVVNLRLFDQSALITSKNHQAISSLLERCNFHLNEDNEPLVCRFNGESSQELFSLFKAEKEIENREVSDNFKYDSVRVRFDKSFDNVKSIFGNICDIEDLQFYKDSINDLAKEAFFAKISSFGNVEKLKNYIENDFPLVEKNVQKAISSLKKIKHSFNLLNIFYYFKKVRINRTLHTLGFNDRFSLKNIDDITKRFDDWAFVHDYYKIVKETDQKIKEILDCRTSQYELNQFYENLKKVFFENAKQLFVSSSQSTQSVTKGEKEILLKGFSYKTGISEEKFFDILRNPNNIGYSNVFESIKVILSKFPAIACSMLSAKRYFPPIPGMFDVAIIDEAGQSDFISAIPIMFRSKRIAIVGDPKQLTPIFHLSDGFDRFLMTKNELDPGKYYKYGYTNNTLYSFSKNCPQANFIMLKESYRSCRSITSYISSAFYEGNIKSSSGDNFNIPKGFPNGGIVWRSVSGSFERSGTSVICKAEAEIIISLLYEIFEKDGFEGSVGVISPYKAQATYIQKLCEKNEILVEALASGSLIVDTVHRFQGSERDCMIFSLCYDENRKNNSFVSDPPLMNVAISRAKGLVIIVGNRETVSKSDKRHLNLLASPETIDSESKTVFEKLGYESPYEMEIGEALKQLGYSPKVQLSVGKRRLDLALVDENRKLDIEIDGETYHRDAKLGIRKVDDFIRDKEIMLHNFAVIRIWCSEIRQNKEACINKIINKWNELGTDEKGNCRWKKKSVKIKM